MRKVKVVMSLNVSSKIWTRFVLTRVYLANAHDGTEVTLSHNRIKLRRISPVPRDQYLEIYFRKHDDGVLIESAQMVTPDDSEIPYTPEMIRTDVTGMINESASMKLPQ